MDDMAWKKLFEEDFFAPALFLRLLVCIGALAADRMFEKVSFAPRLNRAVLHPVVLHPVVFFGSLAERCERIFNRAGFVSRFWRGVFCCVGLAAMAFVAGFFTDRLLSEAGWTGSVVGGIFVCGVLIAHASLDRHVACVEVALREDELMQARARLSHLVGRETRSLSKERVARGALESLSENCSDGTVAPLLYYVLFGLGGLFAYKAVNTLDSMFGYRGARFGLFGCFSARLDDVANMVPSRLTAWFFCAAAFCLREFSGRDAFRIMRRDALSLRAWRREGYMSSPNALHPEAAMAGALGVRLGGMREYRLHGEVWRAGRKIGDGKQPCDWRSLVRARRLVSFAVNLLIGVAVLCLVGTATIVR